MTARIFLTGFMGSGKTTIGQKLAQRLGWSFLDTDELIRERFGLPIAEIFARYGETRFRQVEAEVCAQVTTQEGMQVVALGGGALLNPQTRARIEASGRVFCLSCDLDEILRRLGEGEGRPLFRSDRATMAALLQERQPIYSRYPQIDTTRRSPEEVVDVLLRLIESTDG